MMAGRFDSSGNAFHVFCEHGMEQGLFVGEVLVERADRDAGSMGYAGGGEPVGSDGE